MVGREIMRFEMNEEIYESLIADKDIDVTPYRRWKKSRVRPKNITKKKSFYKRRKDKTGNVKSNKKVFYQDKKRLAICILVFKF